jgi:PleD family two-component response regulator
VADPRPLTEQAEGALKRIRLYDEVRSLSLTDELTGVANCRHMRLVLGGSLPRSGHGPDRVAARPG